MDETIGLIVKGGTVLFLRGADPGSAAALAVIGRYRIGDFAVVAEHGLEIVRRPSNLSTLTWKYGFFTVGAQIPLRLEPGPFDQELHEIVRTMDGFTVPSPEARGD